MNSHRRRRHRAVVHAVVHLVGEVMVTVIPAVIMQHVIMIMVIVKQVHPEQVHPDPHHLPIVLHLRRLLLRHTHVQLMLVVNGVHLVVAIGDIYQRRV